MILGVKLRLGVPAVYLKNEEDMLDVRSKG
jgi:hypothetical protein